jgi:hypothetical protein
MAPRITGARRFDLLNPVELGELSSCLRADVVAEGVDVVVAEGIAVVVGEKLAICLCRERTDQVLSVELKTLRSVGVVLSPPETMAIFRVASKATE